MFLKKEISGTVLNDIWNKYNIQADSMCAERLRVYAILRDTMLAEDVREIQWKLIHSKFHSSHAHMLQRNELGSIGYHSCDSSCKISRK